MTDNTATDNALVLSPLVSAVQDGAIVVPDEITAPDPIPAVGTLVPAFATTPKGRVRKPKRDALRLLEYASTHGPRVNIADPNVLADLEIRGLPARRVALAVFELRRYYGVSVTPERTGRKVTTYVVNV